MDAYTAKKIIPRVLVTIILINLSYYLMALAVDVTNIIGQGITSLIYLPFGQSNNLNYTIGSGASIAALLGTAGTVWASIAFAGPLFSFLFLFILLPAALAIVGVFVTLFIRQALIIFLVLSAPVALALYVLPNTEKYAKSWWNLLFKTLLVYPIVMTLFAISHVAPSLLAFGSDNILTDIMKILALILPLFLVPFAFKLAGGAIGTLFATLSGWSKRGHQGILGNPNDQNSLRNRTKRNLGERASWQQARFTDAGRKLNATRTAKATGWLADRFGNVDARLARYNALSKEQAEQMSSTGRDELRYAAGGYRVGAGQSRSDGTVNTTGKTEYFNSKGKQISANTYNRGKSLYGSTPTGVAQNLEYALRKAQTDGDVANMRHAFAQNAIEGNWNQDEINDQWAAITYPHKAQLMASEWYSKPKLVGAGAGRSIHFDDISNDVKDYETDAAGAPKLDAAGNRIPKKSSYTQFIGDLHKTRLGYQLPGRDQDYRAMLDRQTQLEDKILAGGTLDQYEADQLAMTYEVFDAASQSYGTGGVDPAAAGGSPTAGVDRATAGSAAAQPVIQQALKQRRDRKFSLQTDSSNTATAANTRQIVRNAPTPLPPGVAGPPTPATPVVVATAKVTGDRERTDIPRNVS